MNKSDFSVCLFELLDKKKPSPFFQKDQIAFYVDLMCEGIKNAVAANNRVEIRGFGSFLAREYKSRKVKNLRFFPNKDTTINIKSFRSPAFRSSKILKQKVNL